MKRFAYLLLLIPAFALILAAVPGCPKGDNKPADGKKGGDGGKAGDGKGDGKGKAEALAVKTFDGAVKGQVTFDGTAPTMKEIAAVDAHDDKVKCHEGATKDPTWIVSKDGGVEDVIVYLEAPAGKFFAIDDKLAKTYKDDPWIDQPFCLYEPQAVGIFAAYKTADGKSHDTGLKFLVKNSAKVSHNTKLTGDGKANETISKNINPGEKELYPVKYQKDLLPISCDKHTWMKATLKAFDHPFFAVTDKNGNFEIKNLPVGVEVTVKTWHVDSPTVSHTHTFKTGDNDALKLKIKAGS